VSFEPTGQIRAVVLCLFRNGDRILVSRDYDSVKQDHYYRPLGGGIEFGERGRDAIVREIREELDAEIENLVWLGMIENLFTLEGKPGHEIVLVYDATFVDRSLYERQELVGYEPENGASIWAEWRSLEDLRRAATRLVPEGLTELIEQWAKERC
jgi:ADP-ribose pyrophosphatase YjhB (NUDIX family)